MVPPRAANSASSSAPGQCKFGARFGGRGNLAGICRPSLVVGIGGNVAGRPWGRALIGIMFRHLFPCYTTYGRALKSALL